MTDNVIALKSFNFSIRIVKLFRYLVNKNETILSKQLLRSGTSIGANIHESISAQSASDFIHKLEISLKESRETEYWLKLLTATGFLDNNESESILSDINEIISILVSIIMTTKKNNNK